MRKLFFFMSAASLIILVVLLFRPETSISVILATTTSTQDSGLLDVLVPVFEKQTGYTVKTVAIGTGQALATGARGEVDVVLVHAPDLEKQYVAQGVFFNRRSVMYNDFVVVGPEDDPAEIRGTEKATEALAKIAKARFSFVSRGDNSGTHFLEKKLWDESGIDVEGPWYIEAGQGMGATLMIASEKDAYVLTDRGTYMAFEGKIQLELLFQGDPLLLNPYHVMELNPTRFPEANRDGARAFADFLVSPEVQETIRTFGVDRFGSPLFFPDA